MPGDVLCVPGSTARADVERCIRAISARMKAFERRPLLFYSPTGVGEERVAQVQAIREELSAFDIPGEAAYMMRTSGSASGTGKIVVLTTASLVASARATHEALGGAGRWVTCLPPAHIAGFQTLFRSLLAGHDPIWAGSGKEEQILDAVGAIATGERAYLSLVPTQLSRLLDSSEHVRATLRRVDAILMGGQAIAPALLDEGAQAGLRIVTTYGMTETCGGCVYDGLPLPGVELTIGEGGQISVAGECVAFSYLGGAPFEGTFATSDAGRICCDGKLEVFGRLDGAITTGGLTVIPELVERELRELGVREAVVVGAPSEEWGAEVVAIVDSLPDSPEGASAEHMRAALAQRLEKGWVPRRILTLSNLCLDAFPHLPSGKPDRAGLARAVRATLHK